MAQETPSVSVESVMAKRGHDYFEPYLEFVFQVRNSYADEILIKSITYDHSVVRVGEWTPKLFEDRVAVLPPDTTIRSGRTSKMTDRVNISYETLRRIDEKMDDPSCNISWQVKGAIHCSIADLTLTVPFAIEGYSEDQRPPWTAYSTWKDWMKFWDRQCKPKPYDYIDNLGAIQGELKGMIEEAKKSPLLVQLPEETEVRLDAILAGLEKILPESFPKFYSTVPIGDLKNPLRTAVEKIILDAESSLLIMSPRIDDLYDEIGKKADGALDVKIIAQPAEFIKGPRKRFKKRSFQVLQKQCGLRKLDVLHSRLVICDKKKVISMTSDLTLDGLRDQYNCGLESEDPRIANDAVGFFNQAWAEAIQVA